MLKELFHSLMNEIMKIEPDAWQVVAPGIEPLEIDAVESRLGFPINGFLRQLLLLTNGMRTSEASLKVIFPGYFHYHMLSLSESERMILHFREVEYFEDQSSNPYYPLFTDNMGNYLLVDTAKDNCILDVDTETYPIDESCVIFRSIPSMLKCMIDFYQEGAFFLSSAGEFAEDTDLIIKIGQRNEQSEYWIEQG